jgi:hypothetical protein
MTAPVFNSSVNYTNQLLFPRELYPPIDIPPEVVVYDGIAKTRADMVNMATERRNRYQYLPNSSDRMLVLPVGYTLSDLAVRFEDIDRQWDCRNQRWYFCGGRIKLELTLGIYITREAINKPGCWAMILEHEMRHVMDELDIVHNFLPQTLASSPRTRGFLQGAILDDDFDRVIRGSGAGEGSEFEQNIQRFVWVIESSNRATALHNRRTQDGPAISACLGAP